MVERRTGMPPTQLRFPGAARDFSPRVNFPCRLACLCTPPCAAACINICVHVKNPVLHVRVLWIMETLKTPSMHRRLGSATLGQRTGKSNPNFPWEKSQWAFSNGKFRLPSPGNASCYRVILPNLRCMLGVFSD